MTIAILAYQKSFENVSFQVAAFTRYSSTLFTPDDEGDLIFTGLAGRIDRSIFSNGVQFDASWAITINMLQLPNMFTLYALTNGLSYDRLG
jgi:hypothetical protein